MTADEANVLSKRLEKYNEIADAIAHFNEGIQNLKHAQAMHNIKANIALNLPHYAFKIERESASPSKYQKNEHNTWLTTSSRTYSLMVECLEQVLTRTVSELKKELESL